MLIRPYTGRFDLFLVDGVGSVVVGLDIVDVLLDEVFHPCNKKDDG